MQPERLGAAVRGALSGALKGFCIFLLCVSVHAQTPTIEDTQQQVNEKIRALSTESIGRSQDYMIGRGDVLAVEVFDIPELSRDVRVSQTGSIGLPLLPVRLYVAGLTEVQAQRKIAEVLEANGLVSNPQVIVSAKEKKSKPITIVGAVAHPMVYQADHQVSLVQVLAEAGGISPDASDYVIISRNKAEYESAGAGEPPEIGPDDEVPIGNPSRPEKSPPSETEKPKAIPEERPAFPGPPDVNGAAAAPVAGPPVITASDAAPLPNTITVNLLELLERGNTQNNIPLQAGDVVTVPHAGIVYALGAVQRPGGFVSAGDRSQLSTLKLLALAGGLTRVAKKDHAVIIRTDANGKQQSIPVDLGRIVQRKTEDVRLLPSDILYVPDNAGKAALIRTAELGLAIGSALTIYRLGTGR